MPEMEKKPDFQALEKALIARWEKEGTYRFAPDAKGEVYSIDTPPPTISGKPHIGHAFSYAQTEFIARYRRMAGYNVFYPFGYDNNGLATDRLTEATKNIQAEDFSREEYVKLCLEVSAEKEKEYEAVWKRLGISCDWSLVYRTIAPDVQKRAQTSFLRLQKMGRVYRAHAPTIWSPAAKTAIAQVELEDKEMKSEYIHLDFEIEGEEGVEIATTRPELLCACRMVFVHPKDKKRAHLIGKKAKVPLYGHTVPIAADPRVDPKKGTGVVMFCTFGDLTDVDWFNAYRPEPIIAIEPDGTMNEKTGPLKGLKVEEARKQITALLEEKNLIKKRHAVTHVVNVHERTGQPVEFLLTHQWFIKYLDLKEKYIQAGKQLNWYPAHMRVRYENWVKGLQWDWCISRQRYYGIPFPVWYCKKCNEPVFAREQDLPVDPLKDTPKQPCKCGGKEFEPEHDVLDTWATSSLTPLINARWLTGDKKWFEKIYPMTLRANAHDIISFWDFNTIAMCLFHTDKVPFSDMMISGHGLDRNGKKMSKSKGNVVFPIDVVEKHSADALRWWAAGVKLGEDLNYREEDVQQGVRLGIKLWNTARFVSMHLQGKPALPKEIDKADKWILSELAGVVEEATQAFERYEYSKARNVIEQFFWAGFCDNYLEMAKHRLYGEEKGSAPYTLYTVLWNLLRLFAPFIPFITEALYERLFLEHEKTKSIHHAAWPKAEKEWKDKQALEHGRLAVAFISELRKWKKQENVSLGAEVEEALLFHPEAEKAEPVRGLVARTMRVKKLVLKKGESKVEKGKA